VATAAVTILASRGGGDSLWMAALKPLKWTFALSSSRSTALNGSAHDAAGFAFVHYPEKFRRAVGVDEFDLAIRRGEAATKA